MTTPMMQADLSVWLDQAVKVVRKETDNLERNHFVPALRRYFAFLSLNPATATFVTLFIITGLLPVLSFLAFTIFAASACTFAALVTAGIVTSWIVTLAAGALFMILSMTFAFASFATISGFGILLTYRLFVHVSDAKTDGTQVALERWWKESMARLGPPRGIPSFRAYATAEQKSAELK